jgi:hypothetical protein
MEPRRRRGRSAAARDDVDAYRIDLAIRAPYRPRAHFNRTPHQLHRWMHGGYGGLANDVADQVTAPPRKPNTTQLPGGAVA